MRLISEPKFLWDGPLEGWVKNHIRRNGWKVEGYITSEDLLQESYVTYLHCLRMYEETVDNQRWFMSLFMTAWNNRMMDLARNRTRDTSDFDVQIEVEDIGRYDYPLLELLDKLPDELREVFQVFMSAPDELWEVLSTTWRVSGRKKRGRKEGIKTLASMFGFDPDTDVRSMIRNYLMSNGDR